MIKTCSRCHMVLPAAKAAADDRLRACARKKAPDESRPRYEWVATTAERAETTLRKRQKQAARRRQHERTKQAQLKRQEEASRRRADEAREQRIRYALGLSSTGEARRSRWVDERGERSSSVDAIPVPFETDRRRH